MHSNYLRLCFVTHCDLSDFPSYLDRIRAAVDGGVTCVQFRDKTSDVDAFRYRVEKIQSVLLPYNIPLLINDRVEIAKEMEVDGVHLGQSDMSPRIARAILGQNKIIGSSIETLPQLHAANELDCINYVAASAIFQSTTKLNCQTIWGLEGLRQVTALSKYPVIGIGGLNASNISAVIMAGAAGIAVVSALHGDNPKEISSALLNLIIKSMEEREVYAT